MKAAAIQLNSREDVSVNLEASLRLTAEAASGGAELVALPENHLYIGPDDFLDFELNGEEVTAFSEAAAAHRIYLLAGSVRERIENEKKHHNTSILFGPDGERLALYRKIHLFDAHLPDVGHSRLESSKVVPGSDPVIVETSVGVIGLAVCYDLRFPELFRALAFGGATIITLPANFTLYTGKDHWLPLIRARAIENQVYVIAPAQIGHKYAGEVSYGKSVIVDPWGSVLATAPDVDEAVIYADIDDEYLSSVRKKIPCLDNASYWRNNLG